MDTMAQEIFFHYLENPSIVNVSNGNNNTLIKKDVVVKSNSCNNGDVLETVGKSSYDEDEDEDIEVGYIHKKNYDDCCDDVCDSYTLIRFIVVCISIFSILILLALYYGLV